jgi:glycosyltransferase involved in cell wall biosynthesis
LIASGFQRVEVVGRGVDLERFSPERRCDGLRGQWGADSGWAKNLVPSARMVVVGDGPKRQALQRAYPDAHFVGTQTGDSLAAHYASADLFLFPSLSDTFGNVTLEALASGLPVVAFNVAAAAEHVGDLISGRLINPGDEHAFMTATSLLASLHPELHSMRQSARLAAMGATWQAVMRRFEDQLLDTAHACQRASSVTACVA